MKALFILYFLVLAGTGMAQRVIPSLNGNSTPVFEHKEDSANYSRIQIALQGLSQQKEINGRTTKIDSLMNLEQVMRKRIIGYKLLYRATRSFASLADLREGRMKAEEITKLSITDSPETSIPPDVFQCVNLKELELVNTRIRVLPASLNKLSSLQAIYVYNNQPGRHLKLKRNDHVRQLVLQGITQKNLPRSYGRFARLDSLELSRNIGMKDFPRIAGNKNLIKLNLLENIITLRDLKRGNSSLRDLNLSRNRIERVPAAIGKFPALRKLVLNANQISVVDPAISRLSQLENLGFYQNNLTTIPSGVMSLTNLRTIDCYYNKLIDVDPGIGGLKNLRILYLSHNNISELPESIGQLSNLLELYVHDNKLKSVPESINNLTGLRVLRINNNFLSSLPHSLSPLQQLENLDVSRNYLYQFPDQWAKLPRLQVLGLMNNPWDNKEALEKIAEGLREKGVTCLFSIN